jgi:aminoglycoside phosphotransferase (APT) family kinase protein
MGILRFLFESIYLSVKLYYNALQITLDDLLSLLGLKMYDLRARNITWFHSAKNLSSLTHQNITFVKTNTTHGNRLADPTLSDGLGTGTCLAWLDASLSSGQSLKLFVKIPPKDFFNRLFLTTFGVYQNEFNFYENVAGSRFVPAGLHPKVYFARMRSTRFALVLEDLLSKDAQFPTILDPCPVQRARLVIRTLAQLHSVNWGSPPASIWSDQNRPRFLTIIAKSTLATIQKKFHNELIPRDIETAYLRFVDNFDEVRRQWSAETLTMVHGDTHIGNMHFFGPGAGDFMGLHDWQCVAQEPGMRDIGYFMMSSLSIEMLEANEEALLQLYVDEVNKARSASSSSSFSRHCDKDNAPMTIEEARRMYRSLSWWTLAAWIISAGASNLMPDAMSVTSLSRIVSAMRRIGSIRELDNMLNKKNE